MNNHDKYWVSSALAEIRGYGTTKELKASFSYFPGLDSSGESLQKELKS